MSIKKLFIIVGMHFVLLFAAQAHAQSHAYINQSRSNANTYVLVQQSVEGESGVYNTRNEVKDSQRDAVNEASHRWSGYSIGTGIGVETMKFFQLSLTHQLLNLRQKDDATERMSGSRLNLALKVIFQAPVVNLEIGNGLLASRMDYQKLLESATFYGTGYFYSLGLSYYASSKISLYMEGKMTNEHDARQSGNSALQGIDSNMSQVGLGARIWL